MSSAQRRGHAGPRTSVKRNSSRVKDLQNLFLRGAGGKRNFFEQEKKDLMTKIFGEAATKSEYIYDDNIFLS